MEPDRIPGHGIQLLCVSLRRYYPVTIVILNSSNVEKEAARLFHSTRERARYCCIETWPESRWETLAVVPRNGMHVREHRTITVHLPSSSMGELVRYRGELTNVLKC